MMLLFAIDAARCLDVAFPVMMGSVAYAACNCLSSAFISSVLKRVAFETLFDFF